MTNAYIIEVHDRTAGIVARNGRGYNFFSSERLFDRLEGRTFFSIGEAERAAQALVKQAAHRTKPVVIPEQSTRRFLLI